MKKKKCIAAGALAAFLLCESLFTPNLAGMGAGLLKVQAAAANVALNKEVTSSANESATWNADKAVDGDKTSDSGRWSSGDMGTNRDNPQWLVIDLSAATTNVESINIYFNLKAWSTEYQIQTSDSNGADANWETVYELSRDSANVQRNDPDVINASDLSKAELKRYVRFYFKKGNINGWKCISVREIEIMGTQSGMIETAASVLKNLSGLTVGANEEELVIPNTSEQYDISIYGSELDQLLTEDGKASAMRIGDRSFNVILKATNKNDPQDTAKKNVTVTVKGNTDKYPELFKKVSNPNPMPKVLPTIQEWYGYEGNFKLTEQSRIVVNDAAGVDAEEAAKEMQSDIHDICGLLGLYQGCDIIKEFSDVCTDHGVRNLCDHQLLATALQLLYFHPSTDTELACSGFIDLYKVVLIYYDTTCRKIRALEITHQPTGADIIILHVCLHRIHHFAQVMRRDAGSHTNGYSICSVYKEVWNTHRKYYRLLLCFIKVRHKVHNVLIKVFQKNLLGQLLQAGLCVSHGCGSVAFNGTKVSMSVHQCTTLFKFLRHDYKRIINGAVTVGMIFTHSISYDTGTFTVRAVVTDAQLIHIVKGPALYRLQSVTYIRQRS